MALARDTAIPGSESRSGQAAAAASLWERESLVAAYASRDLRPVEVLLLARYPDAFAQRVLEIGCGGGRVTGYLVELAAEAVGMDISAEMVEYCRRAYPKGAFQTGDLRALDVYADGSFETVFPTFNVIDVLGHDERGQAFDAFHRMLAPGGLLVLSTHNRASPVTGPRVRTSDPLRLAVDLVRLPGRLRNRRRLRRQERQERDYAILNDGAHDYRGLHHYVTRDDGARHLAEHGFEVLECLDLEGRIVAPGETAAHTPELHFVARRA